MRILMLGNSFTFVNDMPQMLAERTGGEVVAHTRGGARLSEHLNPNTRLGARTQAALREEAALSEASSAVESALEESSQGAVDFAVSYYEEPQPITEEEAAATLESLRDTFPDGSYWNHMGLEEWDEFTVTDIPCDHDLYWDTYCNSYTGGTRAPGRTPRRTPSGWPPGG